jgi:glycosyltransferase involved in cell wall biosynthesis
MPIAIYTSTPYRGLDVLAEVWPEILKRCKERGVDPTLKVITSMSLYQWSDDNFKNLYKILDSLPNVQRIDAIPQRQLYEHLKYSSVMLYPNHFLETGCMAVLEALANNNWVVTTNLGALGEQVVVGKNGFLVDGDAHSASYKEGFINASVVALTELRTPYNSGLIFSWQEQCKKLRDYIYNLLR